MSSRPPPVDATSNANGAFNLERVSGGVSAPLHPGVILGEKYLLLRHVGLGAMGQVWVARNTATGAEVAVKVLLPERAASSDGLARFRREAHATAQLTHRGIVRVFDLIELDARQGSLLMVMELLRGRTLAEELDLQGRFEVHAALDIVLPLLSALDHAHGAGIVHRDLKPDNIFLAREPDGQVLPKLVDFGISKMRSAYSAITADGELVGTPCYMSPEQARGASDVDARSDIFSVAILLYELLSGKNPFMGDGLHAVLMAILERTPPPLEEVGVPAPVAAVVARALAKAPSDRFGSAWEFAFALRAAVPDYEGHGSARPVSGSTRPVSASVPSMARSAAPTVPPSSVVAHRRRVAFVGAGAVAVAVAFTIGAIGARPQHDADGIAVGAAPVAREPHVLVPERDVLRATDDAPAASGHLLQLATAVPERAAVPSASVAPTLPAPVRVARPRGTILRDPGF